MNLGTKSIYTRLNPLLIPSPGHGPGRVEDFLNIPWEKVDDKLETPGNRTIDNPFPKANPCRRFTYCLNCKSRKRRKSLMYLLSPSEVLSGIRAEKRLVPLIRRWLAELMNSRNCWSSRLLAATSSA